jgi:hypothetical protein
VKAFLAQNYLNEGPQFPINIRISPKSESTGVLIILDANFGVPKRSWDIFQPIYFRQVMEIVCCQFSCWLLFEK